MSRQALQTNVRTWAWISWEWRGRGGKEEKQWHLRGRADRTWRLINREETGNQSNMTKRFWTWFMLKGAEGKGQKVGEHFY